MFEGLVDFLDVKIARRQRELRDLLLGIPSILIVIVSASFFGYVWSIDRKLGETYREAAESAFEAEDYRIASVCYRRLEEIDATYEDRYRMAIALESIDQDEECREIMDELAPEKSSGYGPAHVWQARKLMKRNDTGKMPGVLMATSHLVRAKVSMHRDGEVFRLLAGCYWESGATEQALEALASASEIEPRHYYYLMKLYQELQMVGEADKAAEAASRYFDGYLDENPDDIHSRTMQSQVLVWLSNFARAEQVIQDGMARQPDAPWAQALATVYLAEFRQRRLEGALTTDLLSYLEKAWEADKSSPEVLFSLTTVAIADASNRAEAILSEAFKMENHKAVVYFVMGSRAWQLNLVDEGARHMKMAYQLDPNLGFAANNLAHRESTSKDGDHEYGLELINQVLKESPDIYAFRETRGQLLTRLGRWSDALDDLQYALKAYPNELNLHKALAECYENLKIEDMAKRHRRRVEQLK